MERLQLRPQRALAVYAHPDDADVAAGGLLATWAAAGAVVDIVVVCQGDKGSHNRGSADEFLPTRRAEEASAAGRHLGVRAVHLLNYPDGDVSNSLELREKLVRLIRRLQPDVVIGPDPTAIFFGGVYVNHRDHREIGWALLDAVAPAAGMPLYFPDSGEPWNVPLLLLSGTHEPDVIADISDALDQKVAAVLAHESQMGDDREAVSEAVRLRAQEAGRPIGVRSGEVFRRVELSV